MTIHEEASQAFVGALADGCACYRCRDAGLRAALDAVALRLRRAIDECQIDPLDPRVNLQPLLSLIGQMEYTPQHWTQRKDTT